uniref:Uncharacterized protein n=1 Tax=Anguilla anguilla TaxID=7936 RepID=A0A0E9R948_ANGAN
MWRKDEHVPDCGFDVGAVIFWVTTREKIMA